MKETTLFENVDADIREQLYNDGLFGAVKAISTPAEAVVRINGILLDIDPCLFKVSSLIPEPNVSPEKFYKRYLSKWLERHSVLRKAEVRNSGTGLHAILWLGEPIELKDQGDRIRWSARIQVIQSILPTDPNAPGLLGLTRKVGSVNSKNGAQVVVLKEREAVSVHELLGLVEEVLESPFKSVVRVLTGSEKVSPCPVCKDSDLGALDHIGRCYECGNVSVGKFMSSVFSEKKQTGKEVKRA